MSRIMAFCGALLCLFASACSLPPFNEDLSLAMATADKLEPVVQIGPIPAWHGDFEGAKLFFMPSRDAPADPRGILVAAGDYFLRLRFLNGLTGELLGDVRYDGPAADHNQKTFTAVALKGGPYLSLALFDPANAVNNTLFMADLLGGSDSFANLFGTLNMDFPPASLNRIVGVHLYPQIDPAPDRFSFLGVLNTSGHFGEVQADANPGSAGGIGAISVNPARQDMYLPSLPAAASGAFYYHRPVAPNASYLSWYDPSTVSYSNYTWDDGLSVRELTGMNRRIDALLSSGELLSFNIGTCTVYDGSGNRKYDFPTGSLRFCFEKYDIAAGQYRMYFTLTYWIYGYEDSQDNLYVDVYSIPTAGLESLD